MNFKDFVDKIDEIDNELKRRKILTNNSIAYNPANWKVKIKTMPKSGYFGTFSVDVSNISIGFDWDEGNILITSAEPLYEEDKNAND